MKQHTFLRLINLILMVVVLAGAYLYYFAMRPFNYLPTSVSFSIENGDSLQKVSQNLVAQGILKEPNFFIALAVITQNYHKLKPGNYRITPNMTPWLLVQKLSKGQVEQSAITIIEGWTFDQMMAVLRYHPRLNHKLGGLSDSAIMLRLGFPGRYPEGWFFPDTYFIAEGMSDLVFLRRAHERMKKKLFSAWKKRAPNLPYHSAYEALIMASLIEKETGVDAERPLVADVLIRRWKKGMRLQVDPTVVYGLGERYQGRLLRADLKDLSHYNTYRHSGLPPTPIAMPGEASIQAALHPKENPYWYYMANGQGGHTFSATLKEHNRAARTYFQQRNE